LRASPESLTSTFKLYRNLDALYDVFESVAESAGAFGSKDEFQSLENDVSAFEKERRSVAERMEALAGAKENEVTRLRAALQTAQANTPVAPAKKTVIDDTAPAKKPAPKKKAAPKPNSNATNPPASPGATPPPPKLKNLIRSSNFAGRKSSTLLIPRTAYKPQLSIHSSYTTARNILY